MKQHASFEWCAKLADIFNHLNELNTRMQGRNENLLTSTDNINRFRSKVQLWRQHGMTILTAHLKSCPGTVRRFRLSDLTANKAENPCSHSHV